MTHGIEGAGVSPAHLHQTPADNRAPQAEGAYRGERVVTVDHQSMIADSMEELPAHLSETVSKKLAQRTASTKSGSRVQEMIEKYLKAVPGATNPDDIRKAVDLLKQMKNGTPGQIKEQLREFLGRREGDSLEGGSAAELLALEEIFGAERGGDAVLAAIRDLKSELGAQLSSFYAEQVKTFEGTSEVYKQLVTEHGEADFLSSVEVMIKKLGGDIQAQGRTMDGPELKVKLDSLYHLEVARNTYSAFAALLDKIGKFQAA